MKIVQTFWTAGKNPLEDGYGWLNSSTHLMAWTLSCLTLREQYKEVHLYTDSVAFDLFHNYLKLPYSRFHIKFDKLPCGSNLWALPKIYTYSYQKEAFLHVDGDVFISQKLSSKLNSASIIAQNKERGTFYYKRMMEALRPSLKHVPDFLKCELDTFSIGSYNLGVFGGNDIDFIRKYCQTALDFVYANQLHLDCNVSININILFEQILFNALMKSENREAACLFNDTINDNGYLYERFCDLTAMSFKIHYLHIIGGYKGNCVVDDLIKRTLLKHYPEYYFRIISLFYGNKIGKSNSLNLNSDDTFLENQVIKSIRNIQDVKFEKRKKTFIEWFRIFEKRCQRIDKGILQKIEESSVNYFSFLHSTTDIQLDIKLHVHPHICLNRSSFSWPIRIKTKIQKHLQYGIFDGDSGLAFIPEFYRGGYRVIGIDKLSFNILVLLNQSMSFRTLLNRIKMCIKQETCTDEGELLIQLLLIKLKFLFFNKCVIIS